MKPQALATVLISWIVATAAAPAKADDDVAEPVESAATADMGPKTICELVESAAAESDIPVDFFTRLLWKESRFRTGAVSPKGAEGIAQFMPATAARRGLSDPFDAGQAIPASAAYLSELAARFGNLGLAAAAYNAGERRVENWLGGSGGLPWETQDYVLSITGRTAEEWALPEAQDVDAATEGLQQVAAETEGAEADEAKAEEDEPEGTGADELPGCMELVAALGKPGAGLQPIGSAFPQAEWAPWGAQVAGSFSLNRAMASYARMQRRHPGLLAGKAPMVVRSVNRSRGNASMFHIRVPAHTRDAADDICSKLKHAGGACIVLKN